MSAGTRSSAITATAPASSAIFACSALTTSMITPPLSISASPLLTRIVPVSCIASMLAAGLLPTRCRVLFFGLFGGSYVRSVGPQVDARAIRELDADHGALLLADDQADRKSTRLNSSHSQISYAVFCLKKKKKKNKTVPV